MSSQRFIILTDQSVQCVVLVPHSRRAVFVNSADVPHLVVLVLDAFRDREFISAFFAEIHRARHILRMIVHFAVIDIIRIFCHVDNKKVRPSTFENLTPTYSCITVNVFTCIADALSYAPFNADSRLRPPCIVSFDPCGICTRTSSPTIHGHSPKLDGPNVASEPCNTTLYVLYFLCHPFGCPPFDSEFATARSQLYYIKRSFFFKILR